MSDPAKSAAEIEDVLTSIRRLVSDTSQPDRRTGPAVGKLVLTPALRVAEPDDPWVPVPPAADAADAADAPRDAPQAAPAEGDDPAWGLEDRLADWGEIEESAQEAVAEAMAESGKADGPGATGQALQDNPQAIDDRVDVAEATDAFDLSALAPFDADAASDAPAGGFEPETGDADWPDPGADSALRDLAAARFGAGAPEAGGDAPLADSPDGDAPQDTAEVEDAAPYDTAQDDGAEPDDPVTTEAEAEPGPRPEADTAQETGAEPAAFTPIFSRRPDAGGGDRDAASPVKAADAPDDEDDDDVEDLGEALSPFSFPDAEDGILDEETLREIVAEVVRQELQGALGQRITRNVRKMVRREIRLALAADDLE
jgi:hypothetical protein